MAGKVTQKGDTIFLNIGQRWFQYNEKSLLGSGAMGTVYKGYDCNSGEPVAIKRVKDFYANNPEIRHRAHQEADLMFRHPNLVEMLGCCEIAPNRGPIFIVSNFVQGENIDKFINTHVRALPNVEKRICELFLPVLDALSYIHQKGIIHMDIKPSNIFYDDKNHISQEEAVFRCSNLKEAIIKPTVFGTWGEGVKLFHTDNGFVPEMNMSVADMFSHYKNSFIIQSKLEQHPDLARLNPTSVNTIRVMSYMKDNEVIILYAIIRIGRMGQVVDNETAGGIKADIDLQTGRIKGLAYGSPTEKNMPQTDSGAVLDGYLIPSFPQVLDFVKDLHYRLPYFRIVGWDITVDKNGKPVMIEWNRQAELSQVAHGPAFGEYTEEILSKARTERNTRFDSLSWNNRSSDL